MEEEICPPAQAKEVPAPNNNKLYLVGKIISVRWDSRWYKAFLRRIDKDGGAHVVFDDPDFPAEVIDLVDIRPRRVEAAPAPAPALTLAGSFQKDVFKQYVQYIVNDTSAELMEFSELDMKAIRASVLSGHATERRDERYEQTLQEFQRSVNSPHECFYLITDRYAIEVNLDNAAVEIIFDSTFSTIVSIQENQIKWIKPFRKKKCGETEIYRYFYGADVVSKMICAIEKYIVYNRSGGSSAEAEATPIALLTGLCGDGGALLRRAVDSSCYRLTTVQVHTTTSTLIFSSDLKVLVTCFQNRKIFSDWRQKDYKKQAAIDTQKDVVRELKLLMREDPGDRRIRRINKEREAKGKRPIGAVRTERARLPSARPPHPPPRAVATNNNAKKKKKSSTEDHIRKINKERSAKGKPPLNPGAPLASARPPRCNPQRPPGVVVTSNKKTKKPPKKNDNKK
jgi:hypothetical protein